MATAEAAKKTDWFPYEVKPIHPGVYETNLFGTADANYSYWNGVWWCNEFSSVAEANRDRHVGLQDKIWRGLAEPSK